MPKRKPSSLYLWRIKHLKMGLLNVNLEKNINYPLKNNSALELLSNLILQKLSLKIHIFFLY